MSTQFKLDEGKVLAALTYLASRNMPELSKGKLCKLLFLADKYHLVRFGRPITGDSYFAADHGPIPSFTLDRLVLLEQGRDEQLGGLLELDRTFRYPRISAKETFEVDNLSHSDRMALDHTIEQFGKMTFLQLRGLTHEMPAYKKAWEQRGNSRCFPMMFEDFFEEDDDAIAGALEEMIETDILNKVFSAQ